MALKPSDLKPFDEARVAEFEAALDEEIRALVVMPPDGKAEIFVEADTTYPERCELMRRYRAAGWGDVRSCSDKTGQATRLKLELFVDAPRTSKD
jgi:hypothetical protein